MIYLGQYEELCPGKGYPTMKDNFSETSYEGKDKILKYLTHGKEDMCRDKKAVDVFSGKTISTEMIGYNDGEYTWWTDLAYYVDKYNLKLPKAFEDKVLNR